MKKLLSLVGLSLMATTASAEPIDTMKEVRDAYSCMIVVRNNDIEIFTSPDEEVQVGYSRGVKRHISGKTFEFRVLRFVSSAGEDKFQTSITLPDQSRIYTLNRVDDKYPDQMFGSIMYVNEKVKIELHLITSCSKQPSK